MSESINAVKTRVIRVAEGQFMPQLSTDGMMWFNMWKIPLGKDNATLSAMLLHMSASELPSTGEVVHSS